MLANQGSMCICLVPVAPDGGAGMMIPSTRAPEAICAPEIKSGVSISPLLILGKSEEGGGSQTRSLLFVLLLSRLLLLIGAGLSTNFWPTATE